MRVTFRIREISFFGSFDICNSFGDIIYTVEGDPFNCLTIYGENMTSVAKVRRGLFTSRQFISIGGVKLGAVYSKPSLKEYVYFWDHNMWTARGGCFDDEIIIYEGEEEIGDISFVKYDFQTDASVYIGKDDDFMRMLVFAVAVYKDRKDAAYAPHHA